MGSPEERDHSSCCFETEHVVAREREARRQQAEQAGQGRLSIQAPSPLGISRPPVTQQGWTCQREGGERTWSPGTFHDSWTSVSVSLSLSPAKRWRPLPFHPSPK